VDIFSFANWQCEKEAAMGASFKDLVVWQRAIQLCAEIYRLSAQFPRSEQFGLCNQITRAAVSIPSNIAEGYGRATRGEYLQFLGHARGSTAELQTQLIIAETVGFVTPKTCEPATKLSAEVNRMLTALMNKLRNPDR
jgi:four helix bundle protein